MECSVTFIGVSVFWKNCSNCEDQSSMLSLHASNINNAQRHRSRATREQIEILARPIPLFIACLAYTLKTK